MNGAESLQQRQQRAGASTAPLSEPHSLRTQGSRPGQEEVDFQGSQQFIENQMQRVGSGSAL